MLKPTDLGGLDSFWNAISRAGNGPSVDDRWRGQVGAHPQIYRASSGILEGVYVFSITYTKTQ